MSIPPMQSLNQSKALQSPKTEYPIDKEPNEDRSEITNEHDQSQIRKRKSMPTNESAEADQVVPSTKRIKPSNGLSTSISLPYVQFGKVQPYFKSPALPELRHPQVVRDYVDQVVQYDKRTGRTRYANKPQLRPFNINHLAVLRGAFESYKDCLDSVDESTYEFVGVMAECSASQVRLWFHEQDQENQRQALQQRLVEKQLHEMQRQNQNRPLMPRQDQRQREDSMEYQPCPSPTPAPRKNIFTARKRSTINRPKGTYWVLQTVSCQTLVQKLREPSSFEKFQCRSCFLGRMTNIDDCKFVNFRQFAAKQGTSVDFTKQDLANLVPSHSFYSDPSPDKALPGRGLLSSVVRRKADVDYIQALVGGICKKLLKRELHAVIGKGQDRTQTIKVDASSNDEPNPEGSTMKRLFSHVDTAMKALPKDLAELALRTGGKAWRFDLIKPKSKKKLHNNSGRPKLYFRCERVSVKTGHELYRKHILQYNTVLFTGLQVRRYTSWTPDGLCRLLGESVATVKGLVQDKWSDSSMTLSMFFRGWSEGCKPVSARSIEDWPKKSLAEELPVLYSDLMSILPAPEYMKPDGIFNLAAFLPQGSYASTKGPKLYIGGGTTHGNVGLINLACDDADTIYICLYSDGQQRVNPELDDGGDGNKLITGATTVWHIFGAEDRGRVLEFLRKRQDEQPLKQGQEQVQEQKSSSGLDSENSKSEKNCHNSNDSNENDNRSHNFSNQTTERYPYFDPFKDLMTYMSSDMMEELYKSTRVEPILVAVNEGEAIVIPAGCLYQAQYLRNAILAKVEHISPERLWATLRWNNEKHAQAARGVNGVLQQGAELFPAEEVAILSALALAQYPGK
ncbi:hypothetical protein BG004_005895 [Podila humilis]|nr:hypothetical protein BG004_005895 [Podila humilis]